MASFHVNCNFIILHPTGCCPRASDRRVACGKETAPFVREEPGGSEFSRHNARDCACRWIIVCVFYSTFWDPCAYALVVEGASS